MPDDPATGAGSVADPSVPEVPVPDVPEAPAAPGPVPSVPEAPATSPAQPEAPPAPSQAPNPEIPAPPAPEPSADPARAAAPPPPPPPAPPRVAPGEQTAYAAPAVSAQECPKSKVAAGVFGILLGSLGVHKFYLGYTAAGLIMLAITLLSFGALSFIPAVIGLIEGILYLTKTDAQFCQEYVYGKKAWF